MRACVWIEEENRAIGNWRNDAEALELGAYTKRCKGCNFREYKRLLVLFIGGIKSKKPIPVD